MRLTSVLSWLLGAMFAASIVCWILLVAGAGTLFLPEVLLGTFVTVTALSLPALVCAHQLERGRFRAFMMFAILTCGITAVGWIVVIWLRALYWWVPESAVLESLGSLSVLCAWFMVFASIMMRRMPNVIGRIAQTITLTAATIGGLVFVHLIWSDFRSRDELMFRTLYVMAVVTGFGLPFTMICSRLRQLTSGDENDDDIVRVPFQAWCPRCGQLQEMQTGGSHCQACGLLVRVIIP